MQVVVQKKRLDIETIVGLEKTGQFRPQELAERLSVKILLHVANGVVGSIGNARWHERSAMWHSYEDVEDAHMKLRVVFLAVDDRRLVRQSFGTGW